MENPFYRLLSDADRAIMDRKRDDKPKIVQVWERTVEGSEIITYVDPDKLDSYVEHKPLLGKDYSNLGNKTVYFGRRLAEPAKILPGLTEKEAMLRIKERFKRSQAESRVDVRIVKEPPQSEMWQPDPVRESEDGYRISAHHGDRLTYGPVDLGPVKKSDLDENRMLLSDLALGGWTFSPFVLGDGNALTQREAEMKYLRKFLLKESRKGDKNITFDPDTMTFIYAADPRQDGSKLPAISDDRFEAEPRYRIIKEMKRFSGRGRFLPVDITDRESDQAYYNARNIIAVERMKYSFFSKRDQVLENNGKDDIIKMKFDTDLHRFRN